MRAWILVGCMATTLGALLLLLLTLSRAGPGDDVRHVADPGRDTVRTGGDVGPQVAPVAAAGADPTPGPPIREQADPGPAGSVPVPADAGRVLVRATDERGEVDVLRFSWSLVGSGKSIVASGETTSGGAWLTVPRGVPMAVRVRAEGHAESLPVDVSLRDGESSRTATVRLVPLAPGAAVVLQVRDELQRPVSRLWIRAEVQTDDDREGGNRWELRWERDTAAVDGRHALDGLAPARFRLHLVAIGADRRPLLLLPATEQFRFDGHPAAPIAVTMRPAGSIELAATTAAGEPCGPGLAIRLEAADGRAIAARWLSIGGAGPQATAGTLPVAGPCELAEPVPAGNYRLHVHGHGIDDQRTILVNAGQRASVQLRGRG